MLESLCGDIEQSEGNQANRFASSASISRV
jgi:hypothetical protein